MTRLIAKISLLALMLMPLNSVAFPELVRHGYSSCLACHASPTGGGVLSNYGRELSREIVSTWGGEKESLFAYGLIPTPDWLLLGGDHRSLQVVQSDPTQERAIFFNMQTDLEAAVSLGPVTVAGSIGQDTSRAGDGGVISRNHYVGYRVNDNIMIRGGRFYPEFGLNIPDHRRATRLFYGFDQGQETYNLEASYITESLGAFVTGIFGRPFENDSQSQAADNSGFAASAYLFLWENSRLGGSVRVVSGDSENSQAASGYAILGFSKKFYLMGELVYANADDNSNNTSARSLANFSKANWELIRGLHVYAIQEFHRADTSDSETDTVGFGGGVQFFPRPHLEVVGEYQKRRTPQLVGFNENLFTLLLHFYL